MLRSHENEKNKPRLGGCAPEKTKKRIRVFFADRRIADRTRGSQIRAVPVLIVDPYQCIPEYNCARAASSAEAALAGDAAEPEGATFWQGVFSVLNILMGVGILSIPVALTKSGWAGLLIFWLLGFVTNYTGKVLCSAQ